MRAKLLLIPICVVLLLASAKSDARRWWSYVETLADDRMEGRLTGSEGHRKAAAFVASEMERAGLQPAGTSGYLQPLKLRARRIVEQQCRLALVRNGAAEPLVLGEDGIISTRVDPAESIDAGIVFAGYGLSVPEMKYDDLARLELRGKVVAYLSGGPRSIPSNLRAHYQSAGERWKAFEQTGAIGTISIQNPRHMDIPWPRTALARFQPSMTLRDSTLDETRKQQFSAIVNPARADKLFAGSGHSFAELLALADEGKPLPTFPLPVQIRASVHVERSEVESQNVIGVLPGTALRDEYVVISAHLDHLGVGPPINGDSIYNGAMDNAAGVASILEIAHSFHDSHKSFGRSVFFVAVTGEEKGLLGSKYFAAHPTVKPESIVADLNVDMFLPLFPLRILTVLGLNESDLGEVARAAAKSGGIRVQDDLEPDRNIFIRSDQYSFIRRGVPSLAFKLGYDKGSPEAALIKNWLTERYHAPSDDLHQPVDLVAAANFNRVIGLTVAAVANRAERPKWKTNSFFRRLADF